MEMGCSIECCREDDKEACDICLRDDDNEDVSFRLFTLLPLLSKGGSLGRTDGVKVACFISFRFKASKSLGSSGTGCCETGSKQPPFCFGSAIGFFSFGSTVVVAAWFEKVVGEFDL